MLFLKLENFIWHPPFLYLLTERLNLSELLPIICKMTTSLLDSAEKENRLI